MNHDLTDVAKVGTIAGGSWVWLINGMPWGEITIIGGAIYVFLKILLILPDLKHKYFGNKNEPPKEDS